MKAPAQSATLARVTRARAHMISNHAFWGVLALHLKLEESTDFETMATDGARLVVNPAFVAELTELELIGVLAHEVSHCAQLHHVRRGARNPDLWQEATDYAINPGLLVAGFTLPKGALCEQRFARLSAEHIYSILEREKKQKQAPQPKPQQGQGAPTPGAGQPQPCAPQPGQGAAQAGPSQPGPAPAAAGQPQGAPGASPASQGQPSAQNAQAGQSGAAGRDPGRCGQVLDAAPAHDPAAQAKAESEWRAVVEQAGMVTKAQGAGRGAGVVAQMVAANKAPRISWRDELRRYADNSMTKTQTWRRPNKRFAHAGLYLPGYVSDTPSHVVAIIDTSGSMATQAVRAIVSELQAMLDESACDRVTLICCNQAVQSVAEFEKGDEITSAPVPSGGTRFAPAFAHVAEHIPDATVCIYLTDLDCDDFGPEPDSPVLWAIYGAPLKPAPWGESIMVDLYQ